MLKQSNIYKGIEYVQLSELPADQRELISQNPRDLIIKIQVDGKILNDCIQFKDYEAWYLHQFKMRSFRNAETSESRNVGVTSRAVVAEKV